MPKLPTFTAKKLIKLLEQNGYVLDHVTGSHHVFYHTETRRRVTVPYHSGDMPKGTLHAILREVGITQATLK